MGYVSPNKNLYFLKCYVFILAQSKTLGSIFITRAKQGKTLVVEIQGTQIRSLGQEEPLEEEMATHSNILAYKIPWIEEPGGLQSMGSQSDVTEHIPTISGMKHIHFFIQ